MSQFGNKFFTTANGSGIGTVKDSIVTTGFTFVLQGQPNAYYRPTALRVYSPTGCSRFLVAVIFNGNQQDGIYVDPETGIAFMDTLASNIQMANGSSLSATVLHFDVGVLHDFNFVLVGQGTG